LSDVLKTAYAPGETFGSAFARLMSALFASRGLILLDPQDARLHQLAAPLLQRAAKQQEDLTAALLAQDKKLGKAGYHAQVKVTERSTLLFHTAGGHGANTRMESGRVADGRGTADPRLALKRVNSGFSAGEKHFSTQELQTAIADSPELFSPNALLRPIVQDTLLPTAAYIGGPAEIAYFAQNSVLYKKLLGRMPAILPRASFTLVEPEILRLLDRYGLEPSDVLSGRQSLSGRMARRHLTPKLALKFDDTEFALKRMLISLYRPVVKLDPTLKGAMETAARKMLYQFEKLRRKTGRAADFRTGILTKHEAAIINSLYPERDLQERSLSLLPFLARYGTDLFDDLGKCCSPTPCAHRFVRL
jgi:bacillithiol biosynthesis cysteine-adding enzyme BshC